MRQRLERALAIPFLLTVFLALSAHARAPIVDGFALPSRRAEAPALAAHAQAAARVLERRLGGTGGGSPARIDVGTPVRRAYALFAQGALEEAASTLDALIDVGARRPDALSEPGPFVSAHVLRASIALARGETRRADFLIERLLRYDPQFSLLPAEDSPRMRAALERTRNRLGPRPAIRAEELGEACGRGTDVVIVARGLDQGAVELARFDGCRPIKSVTMQAGMPLEPTVATLVGSEPELAQRELSANAASPATALVASPAAATTPSSMHPADERSAPVYRRTWFWTVLGVVVAGAAVGTWALTRSPPSQADVVPHL